MDRLKYEVQHAFRILLSREHELKTRSQYSTTSTVGNFSTVQLVKKAKLTGNRLKSSLDILNKYDIFIFEKTI